MKKFLILVTLIVAPFYATGLDVSGGITIGSDYLWRGTSQKGSQAISAGVEANHKGWYTGAWVSEVDYGDKSDYEYDFYTGYSYDINDAVAIDVGVIQYNFNNEPGNQLEEWYVGGTAYGFSAYYWQDLDNSDNHFAEYSWNVPLDEVSISFFWQDPIDFYGINISKDIGSYTLAAIYGEGRDDLGSEAVVSLAYNF